MPRYTYKCSACLEEFVLIHMMSETRTDCQKCHKKLCIERIPSLILAPVVRAENKKVGSVVENFIKSAKEEVEAEKRALKEVEAK